MLPMIILILFILLTLTSLIYITMTHSLVPLMFAILFLGLSLVAGKVLKECNNIPFGPPTIKEISLNDTVSMSATDNANDKIQIIDNKRYIAKVAIYSVKQTWLVLPRTTMIILDIREDKTTR